MHCTPARAPTVCAKCVRQMCALTVHKVCANCAPPSGAAAYSNFTVRCKPTAGHREDENEGDHIVHYNGEGLRCPFSTKIFDPQFLPKVCAPFYHFFCSGWNKDIWNLKFCKEGCAGRFESHWQECMTAQFDGQTSSPLLTLSILLMSNSFIDTISYSVYFDCYITERQKTWDCLLS